VLRITLSVEVTPRQLERLIRIVLLLVFLYG
jgi:hypothetical protein